MFTCDHTVKLSAVNGPRRVSSPPQTSAASQPNPATTCAQTRFSVQSDRSRCCCVKVHYFQMFTLSVFVNEVDKSVEMPFNMSVYNKTQHVADWIHQLKKFQNHFMEGRLLQSSWTTRQQEQRTWCFLSSSAWIFKIFKKGKRELE